VLLWADEVLPFNFGNSGDFGNYGNPPGGVTGEVCSLGALVGKQGFAFQFWQFRRFWQLWQSSGCLRVSGTHSLTCGKKSNQSAQAISNLVFPAALEADNGTRYRDS